MRASKSGSPSKQVPITSVKRHREESKSPQSPDNKKKPNKMSSSADVIKAIEAMRSDFASKFVELNGKLDKMEKALINWQDEKEELIAKQSVLEARLDRLERQDKKNNIVVTGMPRINGTAGEVKTALNELLSKQLRCEATVNEAFQINLRSGGNKVIAKLRSAEEKRQVMSAKKSLQKGIFISDDLIAKDQFCQYKAREFAKANRKDGVDIKIGRGRVYVNGSPHVWDENQQTFISRKN